MMRNGSRWVLFIFCSALALWGCNRGGADHVDEEDGGIKPPGPVDGSADLNNPADLSRTDGGMQIPQGRLCSGDKWCWENPLPQGNLLQALWARSRSDVWAVGDHGTILHYDGKAWSKMQSNTTNTLT